MQEPSPIVLKRVFQSFSGTGQEEALDSGRANQTTRVPQPGDTLTIQIGPPGDVSGWDLRQMGNQEVAKAARNHHRAKGQRLPKTETSTDESKKTMRA